MNKEVCANCGEEKIGHHFENDGKWFCYETKDSNPSLNKKFKLKKAVKDEENGS